MDTSHHFQGIILGLLGEEKELLERIYFARP